MRLLFALAAGARGALARALAFSAIAGLTSSLLVALINQALVAPTTALDQLCVGFVATCSLMLFARWRSQALFAGLEQCVLARLRVDVCARLARAPYREIEMQGPSRLTALLVEDIAAVAETFVMLPRAVMQGAVVLGCLSYLAFLSPPALALALGVVIAGSCIHSWAVQRAGKHLERARSGEDALYAHFRALFSAAKELKLNSGRRHAFLAQTLAPAVEFVRAARTLGLSIYVAAGSLGAFMFFVVIGVVIFLLGVESPVRSAYALMFLYMIHPMESLLEALPELARARVALRRIERVRSSQLPDAPLRRQVTTVVRDIRLSGVTHRYRRDAEDGVFELGPIDIALRPGELTFLVGGNGSGKTTLAKLLVGLYEPDAGRVSLNGRPVTAATREAYRQNFSAVFADFHLFERLHGLSDGRELARVQELLQAFDLAHKVSIRDAVFSTTQLSRGQQKRLALVVACVEDRPAYVFDEWAADQDPVYKQLFYAQTLRELKARNKAVLVITHDDRYFDLADRLLKLEAGKLVTSDVAARAPARVFSLP